MSEPNHSERPYVVLPIEVKKRELDAKTYLAYRFLQRGYPVVIGKRSATHRMIENLGGPFIYLHNCGPKQGDKLHQFVKELGGVVVLHEDEGGVFPEGDRGKEILLGRNSEELLAEAPLYFAWGEWQRETLLEHRKDFPPSKMMVVGHPRFDLRKPRFASCYSGEEADSSTGPILVNTSFSVSNNQRSLGNLKKRWERMMSAEMLDGFNEYQSAVLKHLVELTRELANQRPDREIVFRPHPVERTEVYAEAFEGIENLRIDTVSSVHEVASKAAAVVHHDCTTSIEAAFFGHRPISVLHPTLSRDYAQILPLKISRHVTTSEELVAAVDEEIARRGSEDSPGLSEENAKHIRPTIANTDFDSSEVIVDAVIGAMDDFNLRAVDGKMKHYGVRGKFSKLARQAMSLLPDAKVVESKMPGLDSKEVEGYMAAFAKLDDEPLSVELIVEADDCFVYG